MPYYPEEVIEDIRSRADIVDIISEHVHLEKRGTTYFGLCPFHSEKSPSFSVTPSKGMYYCFGCAAGGNVFSFLQEYDNMTFPEAVRTLAEKYNVKLPEVQISSETKRLNDEKEEIRAAYKAAAAHYYHNLRSEEGRYALAYYKDKRALSDETINKFGLGYCSKKGDSLYNHLKAAGFSDELMKKSQLVLFDERRGPYDRFFNRAIFPIMDDRNRVIAFGGRVLGEGEPKYLNSPETMIFDKSNNMFGMFLAKKTRRPHFILCEGYMDVIALHQAGFDCAVASLGTAFTEGHARLIQRYGRGEKEVIISFDSDGPGQKACARAIPILRRAGISCRVLDMKPYKDPDEFMKALGVEEYEKRISDAKNWFVFLMRYNLANYDLNNPDSKTKYQQFIIKNLIYYFRTEAERNNYLAAVCQEFGFDRSDMNSILKEMGRTGEFEQIQNKAEFDEEDKSSFNKNKSRDDGPKMVQRSLLTLLSEYPSAYGDVKQFLDPLDFDEGLYRTVAQVLFAQCQENRIDPAAILSGYNEGDEQQELAKIFNTRLISFETKSLLERDGFAEDELQPAQISKAFKELLVKLKENRIVKLSVELATDPLAANKLVETKQLIQKIQLATINI